MQYQVRQREFAHIAIDEVSEGILQMPNTTLGGMHHGITSWYNICMHNGKI